MKKTLITLALLVATSAFAQDRPDNWNSGDKRAHFTSGVIISGAVSAYTKSAGNGFGAGCAAGIGGEFLDAAKFGWKSYHVSYKDAAVECLGAYVGAQTSVWISPNKITWKYTW